MESSEELSEHPTGNVRLPEGEAPEVEVVDSPEFWAILAERRKQPCLTSAELKRNMGLVP